MCMAISSDSTKPLLRYSTHRMRSNSNGSTFDTQSLDPVEKSIDGGITESSLLFLWRLIKSALGIGRHKQDNTYSRILSSLYYCFGHRVGISIRLPILLMMYVVKLPHAGITG